MEEERRTCIWIKAEMASLGKISGFVRDWLGRKAAYCDSPKERYLIELVAVEACTNVIRYAYPASLPGKLGVCLKRAGDEIEILLLDEGVTFDPTKVRLPDLEESHEGGYGILLMRKIMGAVTYQRRGDRWNCLRLLRRVPNGTTDENDREGLEGLRNRIASGKEEVP